MLVLILIGYNSQYDSIPNIEIAFIALFLYKVFNSYVQFQYTFQKIFSVHGSFQSIIEFKQNFASNSVNSIDKIINSISSIKLKNITFKIDQNKILDIDSNIVFKKGSSYGIVGESGSGKTSLINLITGIYPQENSIFVNGDDLSHLDIHSYRNHIGYVSQDVYVFEDTLRNNITSWQGIDEDSILKYSEESSFIEVVNKFGLEKPVGSFGKDISGGQKQRLGLTRELIKNPDLLILDEATSALDPNAEVKIMNNILKKKNEMIIVIIAHRLSSLMNVDEILFMEKGNITYRGNFSSLYQICFSFRTMCNNQNIYINY
jgi:subfamily B ATP-binding cassette protein MsbA